MQTGIQQTNIQLSLFPKMEKEADDNAVKLKNGKIEIRDFGVRPGDLWMLGNGHILACCSSCDLETVDYVMNGIHAPLLFTSPPYADIRDYKGCDISIDYIKRFIACFKKYADLQCVNLGFKMRNGSIVPYWNTYIDYALENGLRFLGMNVWNKMMSGGVGNQLNYTFPLEHEFILVFGEKFVEINRTVQKKTCSINMKNIRAARQKDGRLRISTRGDTSNPFKKMGSVQSILPNNGSLSRHLHPATFPINLPMEYINACSNFGDYVIEPFAGSGTTILACEKLERNCVAFEISAEYCNVILNLFIHETGKSVKRIASMDLSA